MMTTITHKPQPSLSFSIIVCTYNRADSLSLTLSCLAKQQLKPPVSWEVVVVDNNSKDHTRDIVNHAMPNFPELRYEFEDKQGLSHARNLGIEYARGEILLFTDDDVCPEPDWAQQILDGMNEFQCDAMGGYIAPVWEAAPPHWLTDRFHGFLAVRMDERAAFQITSAADAPFGANMAFKKMLFDKVGIFDTTRGRKGKVLASGEDGELFQRILQENFKVMYLPNARVHHKVEAFRVEKAYFRKWRYQTSRNIAQSKNMPGDRRLMGIPLYMFPQTLRAILNAMVSKFTLPADEAFYKEIVVWHFFGTISGLYKIWLANPDN